jgi:hypothetical protein
MSSTNDQPSDQPFEFPKDKWDIYFTFEAADGRKIEVPNAHNPVSCANLASLLSQLSGNLPNAFGMTPMGVRIIRIAKAED